MGKINDSRLLLKNILSCPTEYVYELIKQDFSRTRDVRAHCKSEDFFNESN